MAEVIYNSECTLCRFGTTCKNTCIQGVGSFSAELMVVFDTPSSADDENASVMAYDGLFDAVTRDVIGVQDGEMFKTYAIKCRDGEGRKPTTKELTACKSYLMQEIEAIKPKCILVLGENAMKMLTGQQKISKYRGQVQRVEITENFATSVVVSYSPFFIKNAEEYLQTWAGDILLAYNTSKDITTSVSKTKITYCENTEQFKQALEYCQQTGVCCFDFETPKLDSKGMGTFKPDHHATMLSVTFQTGSAYVIPLEHKDSPLTKEEVMIAMGYFRDMILQNPDVRKVAHNLNYDHHINRIYGNIKLYGRIDDTMLMAHLIDETQKKGLKDLVSRYFPEFAGYEDALEGYGWENVPIRTLAQYNGTDTDMTYRLMVQLEKELLEDPRVYIIYRNLSMSAFRPLFEAEARGSLIDMEYLGNAIKEVEAIEAKQIEHLNSIKEVRRYVHHTNEEKVAEAIRELTEKLENWRKKQADNLTAKIDKLRDSLEEKVKDNIYKISNQIVEIESGEMTPALHQKVELLKAKITDLREGKDAMIFDKIQKLKVDSTKVSKTEEGMVQKLQDLKLGKVVMFESINFASPKQMTDILFDSPYGFEFKGYQRTTGEAVLKEIHDDSGFISGLLYLRKIQKILGTYLKGIYDRTDHNNRVHTSFLLAGTVSGRLSSRNPNLQNIPNVGKITDPVIRSIVERVKQAFVCPEGNKFVQADYSQAELRIIASLAKEENMLKVYQEDGDMHTMTASTLMGYDSVEDFKEKVDPKEQKAGRTKAKAANFGLIYKISVSGYMDYAKGNYGVELDLQEAEEHVDRFFGKYPKILEYHDIYEAKARKFGYVRTLFGRKRRTPDILSDDNFRRSSDERVSVNSPVQGTAGEFTIFAVALLYLRLDPRVEFCITVHDSIMFYIPEDILESQIKIIKLTMEKLPMLQYFGKELYGVGMKADFEVSNRSWNELEEYELN